MIVVFTKRWNAGLLSLEEKYRERLNQVVVVWVEEEPSNLSSCITAVSLSDWDPSVCQGKVKVVYDLTGDSVYRGYNFLSDVTQVYSLNDYSERAYSLGLTDADLNFVARQFGLSGGKESVFVQCLSDKGFLAAVLVRHPELWFTKYVSFSVFGKEFLEKVSKSSDKADKSCYDLIKCAMRNLVCNESEELICRLSIIFALLGNGWADKGVPTQRFLQVWGLAKYSQCVEWIADHYLDFLFFSNTVGFIRITEMNVKKTLWLHKHGFVCKVPKEVVTSMFYGESIPDWDSCVFLLSMKPNQECYFASLCVCKSVVKSLGGIELSGVFFSPDKKCCELDEIRPLITVSLQES